MHARFIRETLERFIFHRIETAIGHMLADNQYRFRKERSKLDAINQVVGKGKEAISIKWWKGGSKYRLLVTKGGGMLLIQLGGRTSARRYIS